MRVLTAAALGAAIASVGCLGAPTGQAPVDDGGPSHDAPTSGVDASDELGDDAGIDGGAAAPDAAVAPAWPPADVPLEISAARVQDLDGDGADDLVLASRAGATERGIFILRGGPGGIGAAYHGRVRTPEVEPAAFAIGDLGGTSEGDLVVMGGDEARTTILVYPGASATTFAATPLRRDTTQVGFDAQFPRRLVRIEDLEPDGVPDLLLASGGMLFTATIPTLTGVVVAETELRPVPSLDPEAFAVIHDVFTVAGADGHRDLWVLDASEVSVFPDSDLTGATQVRSEAGTHEYMISTPVDLDGDGKLEVIGGFNSFMGVTRPYPIDDHAPWLDFDPGYGGARLIDMRAAQLDGDEGGRIDAVVYQVDETRGDDDRRLSVTPGLRITAAPDLVFDSPAAGPLGVALPDGWAGEVVEIGDFDGDGDDEIVVVARDGRIACFVVGVAAIAPC